MEANTERKDGYPVMKGCVEANEGRARTRGVQKWKRADASAFGRAERRRGYGVRGGVWLSKCVYVCVK
jgi:hypothetical protein